MAEGQPLDTDATGTDLDPAASDSPQDQAPPPESQQPPAAPRVSGAVQLTELQRGYTQSQQRQAEWARALGLPKTATADEIASAITARTAQSSDGGEGDEAGSQYVDPRTLELEARAADAEWRYQGAMFPGTADIARDFADFAVDNYNDPALLTAKMYELLEQAATAASSGTADGESSDEAGAGGAPTDPVDVETGEGVGSLSGSDNTAAQLADLRGTGRIGEGLRRILPAGLLGTSRTE